jgi:pyruvate-formate lyase-activating enzyme
VGNKFLRYIRNANLIYAKKGFKGLVGVALTKAKYATIPTAYRYNITRRMQHPQLQTVFLELTNKCNLRCKMCNWQTRRNTGFITQELFENCVNQLSEMHLDVLNLQFGGESLLHPNFKDFLKYAIEKRDSGHIKGVGWTSNGMLFDQNIADLTVSLGVDWVNFSLDGVGEINDSIRLGSKYSTIEQNIKYLLSKRGSAKKPKVLINIVDHGKTEQQKLDFYDEWALVVDEIELIPSILPDNSWENKNYHWKRSKAISPPSFCNVPLDTMIISWDGKVTFCCFDTCFKTVLGDATKEPIKQIWASSKFQNLRRAVLTKTFSASSPCHGCEFWQVNFEPRTELILNGKAKIEYGYIYRRIKKATQT